MMLACIFSISLAFYYFSFNLGILLNFLKFSIASFLEQNTRIDLNTETFHYNAQTGNGAERIDNFGDYCMIDTVVVIVTILTSPVCGNCRSRARIKERGCVR